MNGTVVITGGTAGVGRATALLFARRGWSVAVMARGRSRLDEMRRDLEGLGASALALQVDVADAAAVDAAADEIERGLSPVDVWINSAMVTVYGRSVDITPDEFLQVARVTYLGQVHGTLAALRSMRRRDRGTIVGIGSALAYRSIPFQAPYCAAKAATRGFVDSLRSELIGDRSNVRLTMVHLPAVDTPQFDWARNRLARPPEPVPPVFTPEAVAEGIYSATLDAPREVWLGLSTANAIVAQMAAPAAVDRYLAEAPSPANELSQGNLYEPAESTSRSRSRQGADASDHVVRIDPGWLRGGLALAGLGLAIGGIALATRSDRRRRLTATTP